MKTAATTPWARIAFGIDIGEGSPIIVKATKAGGSLAFERVTLDALAAPPESSIIVGSLLQKESFTRWLTASINSAQKAKKVFPSLLDIQLPFSVEDCEYAILQTSPAPEQTGTRGLATGARNVDIEKRLTHFSAVGVNPHLLDQEGIALWTQALEESPFVNGSPELRLIVYWAPDRVTLALGKKEEFLGAHTMRQWDADQIHRILKSYFPVPPPLTQWFITGPQATLPAAAESPLASLSNRWPGPVKMTREPDTFFARALATRALTPGLLRCNLRTGQFLHPVLTRREAKRPYQWATALLVAGLGLCTLNIAWLAFASHRTAEIQNTFRSLACEITGSPLGIPPGQEVLTSRRAIESQTRDMGPFLAATDTPLIPMLKAILIVAREENLSLETLTLSRENMVIHGFAPNWPKAEAASRRLNQQGWVATLERKEAPAGDGRSAFVIGLGRSHEKK